ncbi:MAG: DUF2802 domain-containing protein [Azonexus sp.]|jgi:hypothetical protein|nr:DUF2802 domain-containing protein [Azonexus sp.]
MDPGGWMIGMREGVIVLIALVALYILVVILRMFGLARRPPKIILTPPPLPPDPPVSEAAPLPPSVEMLKEQALREAREEFERQRLEREVFQLRDEVDALRGELAALRQDMQQELTQMQTQIQTHLQAAQTVSPIYGEAVQMAAAGYDPAIIAERCGIARAEADLVVALAKNQER